MTDIISSNDTTEPTYTVTIADTWGDTVVQMTKPEIEATAKANNTWVFIDNQLVNTSAITTSQLDAAEAIRLMPGLLGGSEPTYTVTIADLTGDTVVQMTKPEIEATAKANNAWIFVNDRLIDTSALAETNLDASSAIRVMPGIVGGA